MANFELNLPALTRIPGALANYATGGTVLRDLFAQFVTMETGDGFNGFIPWNQHVASIDQAPPVTRDEARALPGIGRGVAYQCGVIAQLKPRAYRNVNRDEITEPLWPTPGVLLNPAPDWHPLPTWLYSVAESLKWHGNAFAFRGPRVCDSTGYPVQLPLLNAERMAWRTGFNDYEHTSEGGRIVNLEAGDVLHMAIGVEPERRMGAGILASYQNELKLIRATEQAQFVVMQAGVPTGIIKLTGPTPSPGDAAEVKKKFLESQRVRSVAVIANAEFQSVAWNPNDMAMIPAREFNLRLASDITGTPPYMLGVPSESRVYANQETEWTNFLRGSIGYPIAAIEFGLSTCVPRGTEVKLPIDQLLRADAKTRWDVYRIGHDLEAITTEEIRDLENFGPMPDSVQKPRAGDGGPDGDGDQGEQTEQTEENNVIDISEATK